MAEPAAVPTLLLLGRLRIGFARRLTFFHRAGWQNILRGAVQPRHTLPVRQADGRIRGDLPLAHVNSLFLGYALVSLPFAVYPAWRPTTEALPRPLKNKRETGAAPGCRAISSCTMCSRATAIGLDRTCTSPPQGSST